MRWQERGRLVMVLTSFLFLFGCAVQGTSSVSAAGFLDTTQMFSLKDVAGNTVRLETVLKENKAVLINFWATWCPPCREEIPDLIELQKKYQNRSFTVIGVNVAESEEKVARFVEKEKMNYPVVLDSDQRVAEQYRVVGIPTTLLVTGEGKVIGQYHAFTRKLVSDIEKTLGDSSS